MALLLGLDVGTTSVKAGVYDASGRLLGSGSREYRIDHPAPDRAELDAETYWTAAVAAVREALSAPGVEPSAVAALGVSSQGETVVPVDGLGRPVGPALIWLDNRAVQEAADLSDLFGGSIYERTGIPEINPTWTAAKLLWLKRNEPAVFAAARRFLLVEDFVLARLTGRFATDGSVQCTSMLYDIARQGWWPEMLAAVGLDETRLPELVAPGSVAGPLTPDAAAELGLTVEVSVVACGMDQCSGAVGAGNTGSGIMSESTGGALTLQATVAWPDADATRQIPVYVHSAPGLYLYCPVCPTGGMALTWFRDRFGAEEVARAAATDRSAYELLDELAATVPPGAEGLVMLPHLMGAFSPEYEPSARGVFFGFTLHHGKAHFARAVLEAVAFMLRRNLEMLAAAGAPATEIRSHGGGSRSPLWNQIKADVCGLPVATLRGEDAAPRGDAMLAGVAAGLFPDLDAASAAFVHPQDRYEPDPAANRAYDPAYRRYVDLFDALSPVFRQKAGEE